MDWTLALQRNQSILLRIVAALFVVAGMKPGEMVSTLPRHKRSAVLMILRPAESAYRRVVFIAVIVLGVVALPLQERAARPAPQKTKPKEVGRGRASFRLIDPRKNFGSHKRKYAPGPVPRVTVIGSDLPIYDRTELYAYQNRPAPTPDDDISATRLCHRLNGLYQALDDLPKQALRMATLRARMKRRYEQCRKPDLFPIRPGPPPGLRQKHRYEIDEVLFECQRLAMYIQTEPPDTS